jgi:hypothetical protein
VCSRARWLVCVYICLLLEIVRCVCVARAQYLLARVQWPDVLPGHSRCHPPPWRAHGSLVEINRNDSTQSPPPRARPAPLSVYTPATQPVHRPPLRPTTHRPHPSPARAALVEYIALVQYILVGLWARGASPASNKIGHACRHSAAAPQNRVASMRGPTQVGVTAPTWRRMPCWPRPNKRWRCCLTHSPSS